MKTRDGEHRIKQVRRDLTSVVVTPLAPPFLEKPIIFKFENEYKELALSKEDAAELATLLGNRLEGCDIVMEKEDDVRLRISVVL